MFGRLSKGLWVAGGGFFLSCCCLVACKNPEVKNQPVKKDYIRAIPGENDTIPAAIVQKGEVLIAYSDCYTCHTEKDRAKGPAFEDIAKRYPINDGYIELLAQKIILGGTGAWGYPVMSPHPDISVTDAKTMVKYILSLKEKR